MQLNLLYRGTLHLSSIGAKHLCSWISPEGNEGIRISGILVFSKRGPNVLETNPERKSKSCHVFLQPFVLNDNDMYDSAERFCADWSRKCLRDNRFRKAMALAKIKKMSQNELHRAIHSGMLLRFAWDDDKGRRFSLFEIVNTSRANTQVALDLRQLHHSGVEICQCTRCLTFVKEFESWQDR